MFKKIFKFKNTKGFAMVESLMAIFVLTMAIMAPLSLAMTTTRYSRTALDRIQATYFAEESIEMLYSLLKSAEVYCVDGDTTACTPGYFDYFYNNIPADCKDASYCNFDLNNLEYDSYTKKLLIENHSSGFDYLAVQESDLAAVTSNPTNYKRSINIKKLDSPTTSGGISTNSTALVTVIVCVNERSACTVNSPSKVVIQDLIENRSFNN